MSEQPRFHHYPKERLRDALEIVRDDLRSGAIRASNFDMCTTVMHTECGTVACIGGHVALLLGMDANQADAAVRSVIRQPFQYTSELIENRDFTVDADLFLLFYGGLSDISRQGAADRIDEYLRKTA